MLASDVSPESLSAYICALRRHPRVAGPHGPIQPGEAPTPPSAEPAATTPTDTPTRAHIDGFRRTGEPAKMADLISKRTSANIHGRAAGQLKNPVSAVRSRPSSPDVELNVATAAAVRSRFWWLPERRH